MVDIADLRGIWRRSLIAWPDGRQDTTTQVRWLQAERLFGDLRQPAALDWPRARALCDFTREDCLAVATQEGFAGYLTVVGKYFEWSRVIDFQPPRNRADAGSLRFDQNVLIEEGRDVEYLEHWHRDAGAADLTSALLLKDARRPVKALLLRVGDTYLFARDRAMSLPAGKTLAECVAAAASVASAQALIDCEISIATCMDGLVTIRASTLPFRVGESLTLALGQEWHVLDSEGDSAALDACRRPG